VIARVIDSTTILKCEKYTLSERAGRKEEAVKMADLVK
jgi:hypothetical protein